MKKLTLIFGIIIVFCAQAIARPKYVFYFIGDGMGINTVELAEMYLASLKGELGVEPMVFSQFPVVTFGTTYAANGNVTDSSASGTALATGTKTLNNHLGLDASDNHLTTMAEMAKRCGYKVGITTSVGINHATPAAFYAHQPDRYMLSEIAMDMVSAGFDFYSGSYIDIRTKDGDDVKVSDITDALKDAGYTISYGVEGFREDLATARKMLLLPAPGKGLLYGIDRKGLGREGFTLSDITESAISFLQKDNKKGFFLMVEGGDIDGAGHGNDAATAIGEVLEFNDAVKVAFEFYKKHPKETIIVVTADHETGGLSLAPSSTSHLARLSNQKLSQRRTSDIFKKLIKSREPEVLSWEETQDFLKEYFGLWEMVPVSWEQEKYLRDTYEITVAKKDPGHQRDLYADNALIIARAVQVLNKNARVYWSSSSHSSNMVPVYVIGAGQDQFLHRTDNAQIAKDLISVAGYK